MPRTVKGNVKLHVSFSDTDTTNPLAPRAVSGVYPTNGGGINLDFPSGTGAGKITALAVMQVTVPSSSTATIDLGAATGPLGEAVAFARVIGFMFFNNDLTAPIVMGAGTHPLGPMTGGATNTLSIAPQFPLLFGKNDATGYAVTTSSADTLTFTNGVARDILLDVIIFGRLA